MRLFRRTGGEHARPAGGQAPLPVAPPQVPLPETPKLPGGQTQRGTAVSGRDYGEGATSKTPHVPRMNAGNGGLLRHQLLQETAATLVQQVPMSPLGKMLGLDGEALARATIERHELTTGAAPLPQGLHDEAYDGCFMKSDGRLYEATTIEGATLYVGGMNSDIHRTRDAMGALGAAFGEPMLAIHNSTSGPTADYLEIAGDLLKVGASRAAQTLRATILEHLSLSEGPLKLVGHSQGTLIVSRAIELVGDALRDTGLSPPEVLKELSRLEVRTFAGTAFDYPDGPRYTHYRNQADPCPATREVSSASSTPAIVAGIGALAHGALPHAPKLGAGAVLVEFHDPADGSPYGAHRLLTYLANIKKSGQ